MLCGHTIKHWSATQPSVSLSSGEAEFYGLVRGSGQGLGYQALLKDLGLDMPLRMWTDSSAAIGICSRQGLGKLRHIDTHTLWVQQAVRTKRFALHKVSGEANPGDLFTKHLASRERLAALTRLLGCTFSSGRAEIAPSVRQAEGTKRTMATEEAFSVDDLCSWEMLPHLMTETEIAERFPAVKIPTAVDYQDFQRDGDDSILQHGLKQGHQVMERAAVCGRLRRDNIEDSCHMTKALVWAYCETSEDEDDTWKYAM